MSGRADRIARSEALLRAVNERVAEVTEGGGPGELIDFICECGDADCVEAVPLTPDEYESVSRDRDPLRSASWPRTARRGSCGARNDRFVVAEKDPGETEIAEATDPRA